MERIAILGCGNLGLSIVDGLTSPSNQIKPHIVATRRNLLAIRHLEQRGVAITSDNAAAVAGAELILLALKPYNIPKILAEIGPTLDAAQHKIISVASSVSMSEIRDVVGSDVPVFRAMPNTATHVRESITCIAHQNEADQDVAAVIALFRRIGKTMIINEDLMEAATILGACGVAYALRFIRAMIQGGIQIGFSAQAATEIASQTVRGAAELLLEGNEHPEREIDKVTTPKGCTIIGLNEMEHAGFSSSLIKGIVASHQKIAD